jgi:LysR family transcriptional regulator for bpeEF and oprC
MDRFLALTVFTKVVEAGSFSAAARVMDLSPASVTEQVQALERHLKTRLLNRTTRTMSLTDEGAAYYEHACQILARMHEADAMLTAQRTAPKGMLRVAMPPVMATEIVLPAMPEFLRQFPELRVEFVLDARTPSFAVQNLDLALQITADIEPGLVFRPLGLVRICTCASPEYVERRGMPRTPDDLERHDVIGVRAVPGVVTSLLRFERDGRLVSLEPKARVIADTGDAQRVLALAHGGIFQGAHYAVANLIAQGRLVRLMPDWEWSGPPLGAVHPPNRFLLPKVGVFLDFLQRLLAPRIAPYRDDWVRL